MTLTPQTKFATRFCSGRSAQPRSRQGRNQHNRPLAVERLEDRALLAPLISVSDGLANEGSATMKFIDAFVTPQSGGLNEARGMDYGPDGNLYVSRESYFTDPVQQGYVQRYDAITGDFLDIFAEHPAMMGAKDVEFGPDGNLYVPNNLGDNVFRFNGITGEFLDVFIPTGEGGLSVPRSLIFGPDGNGDGNLDVYITSAESDNVLRFDGLTGAFIDAFVSTGSGGLNDPTAAVFGPDGNLYVASGAHSDFYNSILRYDGATGAFIDVFVPAGSAGLTLAPTAGVIFGPDVDSDGILDLYVSNGEVDEVLVYSGTNGAFLEKYLTPGLGGLDDPKGLLFDHEGNLLVINNGDDSIRRFGASSQAVLTVTLSEPSDIPITVDFATADVSATAGNDYVAAANTITFTPGVTARTVILRTLDDSLCETNESFAVNLRNPFGATIADGQGAATILANDPVRLFFDSFELGQWNGLWVEDSQNDWFTSTQRKTDGSYSAEVDGSASDAVLTIASPINLTPYGSAELSFDWLIESGLDTGEYVALDLFNGTSWQELGKLRGNVDAENVWHSPVINIDGSYLVSNFQFRFRAKMSGSDEDANVDNVRLIATSLAGPPNQMPIAVDDAVATAEDTAATIDVLTNDSDPDWDALQIQSVTQGSHGAVVSNGNGTLTYTPQANFFGSDNFTYTISDGRGGTDTASVSVMITSVNDAPVAVNDSATTTPNQAATINVLGNDFDVDGDTLVVDSFTSPANGSVINLGGGVLQYTPSLDFTGGDQFTYTISDGQGGTDTATVSIIVQSVSTLHVGDLDGSAKWVNTKKWTATVIATVFDGAGLPVSNAAVQGTWSNGITSTATTDGAGQATLLSGNVDKSIGSVTFTVTNVTHASFQYDPAGNTDPDGDSNGTAITVLKPQALLAASSTNRTAPAPNLTDEMAWAAVGEALVLWSQQTVTSLPPDVRIQVADIPTGFLGWASGNTITLDVNADGAGWYTDLNAPAADRVDLLTVVSHEIGHVLGYGHSDVAGELMYETLTPGTRRLPGSVPVTMTAMPRSAIVSSLLPERLDVSPNDLVDHALLPNEVDSNPGADGNLWMLPLVTADGAAQPQRTPDTVRARIVKTIADEEMELLDDELLNLIVASQQ